MTDERCISVLDTGEAESEISHVGDQWLAQDVLAAVLAGGRSTANVLNADDYGVWVTGTAPICAADGTVLGAVTVDVPALEWAPSLQSDQSHTLAAILRAATIRFSRAEVEAITDGLTGLYNHRYLHERLEEEIDRARRYDDVVSLLFVDCDEFKAVQRRATGTSRRRRRWRASPASSNRAAGASTSRRRYGGEEFVLVLVGHRHGRTRGRSPSVCARRSHHRVSPPDSHLTVSIGVAPTRETPPARTSCSTRPTGRCTRPSAPAATACCRSATSWSPGTGSRAAAAAPGAPRGH